ncbi:MAG: ABC transporter substrate-binding protein [Pseudomonadota bacterium]
MQSKRLFKAAVFVLALTFGQVAGDNAKAAEGDPGQFIQQLASQAIKVLSSPDGSLQEREDKFRALLRDDFAMHQIGRFVVGPYWRRMSPEQRQTYMKLFGEWVLKTYSIRLGGYSGEEFHVINTTPAGKRDVLVKTKINRTGTNGLNATWRVRKTDDGYKIIDIYVEGVSMAITQRSEFESILRRHGIDGLISMLQSRVEKLSAAS